MSLLSVEALNVSFSRQDGVFRALRDVSFTLERGEIFGMVGRLALGSL